MPLRFLAAAAAEVGAEGFDDSVGFEVVVGSVSMTVPSRFDVRVVVGAAVRVRTPHWRSLPEKVLVHLVSAGPVKGPSWKPSPSDE